MASTLGLSPELNRLNQRCALASNPTSFRSTPFARSSSRPLMIRRTARPQRLSCTGTTIEAVDKGQGRPILFLHPGIGIDPAAPVLADLAKAGRVIAPSHPGFGRAQLPKGMTTVDDVSYFYLDLLDTLDLHDVLVVGVGLGGWLAAEIATKNSTRLSRSSTASKATTGIEPVYTALQAAA